MEPFDRSGEWTPDFWEDWLEGEVPWRRYLAGREAELALRFLQPADGGLILDAGCGYGRLAYRILTNIPEARLVAIDISDSMIRATRSCIGIRFRGGRAALESLPFRDGAFDAVICVGVVMHVRDEAAALRELCRVLRPGGRLVLSFNSLLSPFSLLAIVNNRLVRRGIPRFVARMPRFYVRELARHGVRLLHATAATILCVDPAIPPLRRLGIQFLPEGLLSRLIPADRRLSEGRFKWLGHEVVLAGERFAPASAREAPAVAHGETRSRPGDPAGHRDGGAGAAD
jgi:SAM-dependent methyltransferase